ncbi:MAG: hypothetical protein JXQ96_08305 [Cyclobacteriaceae bacterium]
MNRLIKFLPVAFLLILIISSCADATNIDECRDAEPYGFISGLFHGCIAPFTFVVSLFSDEIAMYAVNNNGGWYDFGFVIGAGILFGGSSKAKRK